MNTNISFKPNYFGKSGDGSPEWHRWRLHGKNGEVPVTIGGSDVGVSWAYPRLRRGKSSGMKSASSISTGGKIGN